MRRTIAVAAMALASAGALANPLETIDVLCGGVNAEERQRLVAEVRRASVALEFFSGTRGERVADVDVLFTPIKASIAAFGIVTDGPHCLLELPPGEYRIDTWFNGHSRSTRATIPTERAAPVFISLGFPEDRGNDALLVPASVQLQASTP